jgi:hypothetical protein
MILRRILYSVFPGLLFITHMSYFIVGSFVLLTVLVSVFLIFCSPRLVSQLLYCVVMLFRVYFIVCFGCV